MASTGNTRTDRRRGRRPATALLAVLVGALLAALPAASGGVSATACPSHWVVAWGASPSDASANQYLDNQTLRMIIAPHLAGSELRLRFSNRFSGSPATLGSVHVGLSTSGPIIVPGSNRPVTFGGQSTATIPAGGELTSDPVAIAVTPFSDLAVSVAIDGTVSHPTEHSITRQTSYLSPLGSGDHGADETGAPFTMTTAGLYSTGWYLLDGADVLAPTTTGAVVAFGDSLTDGFQGNLLSLTENDTTIDQNDRYPDDLARRLLGAGIPLSVLDAGISGNELVTDQANTPFGGPSGLTRLPQDALQQPGASDLIVMEGINDIGTGSANAGAIINGLTKVVDAAHAAGLRAQLGTLPPTGGSLNFNYSGGAAAAERQQVNAWIRGQQIADGVIDFDAAVRDPGNPGRLAPIYDGGDGIHLDPAGYQALADAVNLGSLATPTCTPGGAPGGHCPHTVRVTLPSRYARRLRSATVELGHRVVARLRPGHLSAAVKLDGRAVTLRIVVHQAGVKSVTLTRRVGACLR